MCDTLFACLFNADYLLRVMHDDLITYLGFENYLRESPIKNDKVHVLLGDWKCPES